jgi:NADH-ubiquinone oxidoreductase chain 5
VAYAKYTLSGNFSYFFGCIVVLLTSYYSFRLLFLTFLAPTAAYKSSMKKVHDAPILMASTLIVLAFGSIFVGYLAKDMMIGLGTDFWSNALFVLPQNSVLLESEYIPQAQKFVPLIFTLLGAIFAYIININAIFASYSFKMSELGRNVYTFLNKRWFFDKVYNDYFSQVALTFGYTISFKTLDKGSFEILGPSGIANTALNLTQYVSRLQSGMIYHYAVVMLIGLLTLITIGSFWDILQVLVDPRLYFIYILSFLISNYNETRKH